MSENEPDDMAEQVRDLIASDENGVTEGCQDYGVLAIVMEEHEHDCDVGGVYKTDFREDADDATVGAFAAALSESVPQLLLEMALKRSVE